jgi:hypothetical protein
MLVTILFAHSLAEIEAFGLQLKIRLRLLVSDIPVELYGPAIETDKTAGC